MNKKYTYIWISLVILVFGIIFIPRIIERIKGGTIVQNDRMNVEQKSGQRKSEQLNSEENGSDELAYILFDGEKRKAPSFAFTNQDSVKVTNNDYLGKVFVVDFFFTRCPAICPIMTENMVSLQDQFEGRDDFGIASFSITPDFDTPKVLKEYAEKYGIKDADWHLMTGDSDEIYELANKGFNIYATENADAPGGFEHSGLFALIDKEGYIRSRIDSHGNPIIYYRGAITEDMGENELGEKEQISLLKQDIQKLLEE